MRLYYFLVLVLITLVSCDTNRISENNLDFESRNWPGDSIVNLELDITDTVERYQLFLNLRNTVDYPFQNIYIGYWLKDSVGTTYLTNTENLQELSNFVLFDPKSGEPYGKGLGDIFEHRFLILDSLKFHQAGKNTLSLQQYMRKENLSGIVSIGYRLELQPSE